MGGGQVRAEARRVGEELGALQAALRDAEALWDAHIGRVDFANYGSAVNLAHYWAVRQYDLRRLQRRLARLGLSSLGRSEPHVQAGLAAIAAAAGALSGAPADGDPRPAVRFGQGGRLLRRRAAALLGEGPRRSTRIMATLPTEAATDPDLIGDLVAGGMDLARVNCAHDDAATWAAMIAKVRRATAVTGRPCRVAMDLAGPKLRTGPLEEGPRVVRLRPVRSTLGEVTAPAHCLLVPDDAGPVPGPPNVPVPRPWLARRRPGEAIGLRDARGADRRLLVEACDAAGVRAATYRTAYVRTGGVLRAPGGDDARVGPLPPVARYLTLHAGDTLTLTRDCAPAPVGGPPRIGCTLPEAFGHVRPGERVLFDDGRIGGVVESGDADTIAVRITVASPRGSRLRAAKGVNLPDTRLPLSALTGKDRADLDFAVAHADLVELSFVRDSRDVADLLDALDARRATGLGVVVKIETVQGFANLPEILFTLMRRPRAGVMIARGDLAVESGYERLAEVQEEILWLCEAAHLPVIWATQVLDRLAKSGVPTRAEITDAAMGARAECVMLNKGPYMVEAVIALDDILGRMTAHQYKKNTLMRGLHAWRRPAG